MARSYQGGTLLPVRGCPDATHAGTGESAVLWEIETTGRSTHYVLARKQDIKRTIRIFCTGINSEAINCRATSEFLSREIRYHCPEGRSRRSRIALMHLRNLVPPGFLSEIGTSPKDPGRVCVLKEGAKGAKRQLREDDAPYGSDKDLNRR